MCFQKYVIAFQRSKTLKRYQKVVLRTVFANLRFPTVRIDRCEYSHRSASFCRCMINLCVPFEIVAEFACAGIGWCRHSYASCVAHAWFDGQLQVQSSTLLSCPCQISISLARFLHMRRSCSHVFFEAIWVFEPFSVVIVFDSSRSYCSDGAVVLCRLWCGCPTASIHSSEQHFYPFRTVFFGVAVGWRIDKFTDQSRPHELERKLLSTTGQRMSVRVPVKPRICLSVLWYLGSF